jgi:uncharacterized protein
MIENHIKDNSLKVLIRPKSRKNEICGFDESRNTLVVRIKAVPEDGKANAELIRFLKKELKRDVTIKSGFTSREKVLRIV